MGGGWFQDHMRAAVNDWQQKWPAIRVLTVAWQHTMTKASGSSGQECINQPMMGAAKGGRWLVSRPPEGSGQQLASKGTGNKSVNGCTAVCYDKSRQWTTTQQLTNNRSSKGQAGAGEEIA